MLQQMGARVISVDEAPLDPGVAASPASSTGRMSAFALDPRMVGPLDWLFSDLICYPARLFALVEPWLAAGTCRRLRLHAQFQGADRSRDARRFAEIPGSRLLHLFHNKHELTWSKFE